MNRWLREPLLHFVLLGALLFVLYGWLHGGLQAPNEIVIDEPRVAALSTGFQRQWQRPPTASELQGLIDNWVREEVLVREGLAQGLDRNDTVVRRRVLQKMAFLSESFADAAPSDAELQAWLDSHPADYGIAPRYSLEQVYFDPLKHGAALDATLASARAALERDSKARVGDDTMLPAALGDEPASELARIFGDTFVKALAPLPAGSWQGPVRSGFGVHLVRIVSRTPGRVPALAEVRAQVERDLRQSNRQKSEERFYQNLRKGYVVKQEITAKPPDKVGALGAGEAGKP